MLFCARLTGCYSSDSSPVDAEPPSSGALFLCAWAMVAVAVACTPYGPPLLGARWVLIVTALLVALAAKGQSAQRAKLLAAERREPAVDILSYRRDAPFGERWRVRPSQLEAFVQVVLRGAPLTSLVEGRASVELPVVMERDGELVLVCGGPQLLAALRGKGMEAHASSHIGRDEGTAMVIAYPTGDWYGRLTPCDAEGLMRRLAAGERWEEKFCGNAMSSEGLAPLNRMWADLAVGH